MTKVLAWLARVLLWPVTATALLLASAALHVPTALGRAAAEDAINHLAGSRMPGRLHVDSVDELELGYIAVSGLAAYDLDDVEVISVDRGSMRMDPWAAHTGGVLRLRDMQGYGGRIVIRPGQHHKVSIKDVFSSGGGGEKTLDLDLGWLWAENTRLEIRMIDRPLTFQIATASVNIERFGQSPVEINLRNVNAKMVEPAPLGVDIRMVGVSGGIRPQTDEVVNLTTGVCLGAEPLQARIIFRPGPPRVARVVIDYESGLGFLASAGLRIGGLISGPLEVDEREIPGEPPQCEGEPLVASPDGAASEPRHPAAGEDGEVSAEELDAFHDRVGERLDDADERLQEALETAR